MTRRAQRITRDAVAGEAHLNIMSNAPTPESTARYQSFAYASSARWAWARAAAVKRDCHGARTEYAAHPDRKARLMDETIGWNEISHVRIRGVFAARHQHRSSFTFVHVRWV